MSPSRTDRKDVVNVVVVGCGRISRNHFDAIRKVEGLHLSAVADSDEGRARAAGEEHGVKWFTDFTEMLRAVDSDIVTIATPSGMHSAQGIVAANAGKHVITEKPMAITLE